jgi:hypothetical protein
MTPPAVPRAGPRAVVSAWEMNDSINVPFANQAYPTLPQVSETP